MALDIHDGLSNSVPEAVKKLLISGDYADCQLECNGRKWHLHKAVICAQSSFFRTMFNNDMKETATGLISLPDDDPDAVQRMLQFLYEGDYDYTTTRGTSTTPIPVSSPEDEDEDEAATFSPSKTHLGQNVQLYAMADRYGIPSLKRMASKEFATICSETWHSPEFLFVIDSVYTTTPEDDRALRDIVVKTIMQHHQLFRESVVQKALLNTRLAYDIAMAVPKYWTAHVSAVREQQAAKAQAVSSQPISPNFFSQAPASSAMRAYNAGR